MDFDVFGAAQQCLNYYKEVNIANSNNKMRLIEKKSHLDVDKKQK